MKRNLRSPLRPTMACMGLLLVILTFTGLPAAAQVPPIAEADLQYDLLLQDLGRRDGNVELGVFGGVVASNRLHGVFPP